MWIIIILLFIAAGWCVSNALASENKEKQEKERAFRQSQFEHKRNQDEAAFVQFKNSLIAKYGEPDKIINLNDVHWEFVLDKYIMVFANSSAIYICGKELNFSDIISYKMVDNYEIKHGKVDGVQHTNTDTGSLLTRGIGGALIGGGVGAIIGATTAPQTTTIVSSQKNDKLIHDFTLLVFTRDLKQSTIEIKLGNRWLLAAEIESIFNIILESK